jgi:adenylate cyclase
MTETRKLAAILVSDVAGYSRLAGTDEDRTLARLRTLRSDLIDPIISVHHGRVVKRTGDGSIIEFRSEVEAVRCAVEVQTAMIERNAGVPPEKRIEFRVGIHVGDVVEESDGDLMGDGDTGLERLEQLARNAAKQSPTSGRRAGPTSGPTRTATSASSAASRPTPRLRGWRSSPRSMTPRSVARIP